LREAMRGEELTSLQQNVRVLLGEEALSDTFGAQLDGDELTELLRVNGVEVPFMQVCVCEREGASSRSGAGSSVPGCGLEVYGHPAALRAPPGRHRCSICGARAVPQQPVWRSLSN
jgi:hypothetical protein